MSWPSPSPGPFSPRLHAWVELRAFHGENGNAPGIDLDDRPAVPDYLHTVDTAAAISTQVVEFNRAIGVISDAELSEE